MNIKLEIPETFFRGEELCGYWVSPEMKRVWAVQLDLINEFARICGKHNIRWWMDAGTLLGAARHKGFIPWDDDVDVIMMRKDYDRFMQIAPSETSYPYRLVPPERGEAGYLGTFSKFYNTSTTMLDNDIYTLLQNKDPLPEALRNRDIMSIFLDIFPIDDIPDDERLFWSMSRRYSKYVSRAYKIVRFTVNYTPSSNTLKRPIKAALHHALNMMNINAGSSIDKVLETMSSGNCPDSKCVAKFACRSDPRFVKRRIWERSWFDETVYLPFEMLSLPAPAGYEEILNRFYGNWHEYVIREKHGGFYDTEHPCSYYLKEGHSIEEKHSI